MANLDQIMNHIADYTIVESGTSGNWRYRKWSDGTAECWMNKKENLTLTSWGSLYYARMDADSYPTGLFTEVITVVAQFASSIDMVASARNQGNGMGETLSTTTPPAILGIRPTTASAASYTGMWYAIGKWN